MYKQLNPDKMISTIELLSKRITERFPESSLSEVCQELYEIADDAKERAKVIAQPLYWLRIIIAFIIVATFSALVYSLSNIQFSMESNSTAEFMQITDAAANELVLLGAAMFFLVTVESRIKRARVTAALHELRSIAHLIDMHQLTKDPSHFAENVKSTDSSPKRTMTSYELTRYLDYCSEMLSLTSKVAALYAQSFNDSVVVAAVNDLESLTFSMSSKVWQKIAIIKSIS